MPEGGNPNTQHRVCVSTAFCKCVGQANPWDECCCVAAPDSETCVACGSQLKLIDNNTGEEI